ncbi:heterokaryon incompatibility, partial [Ganoderma leucocontextum]
KYTILSHVWGTNEQTFQETLALFTQCKADGTNPRDCASEKVRRCCLVTESHGYKWIWHDTCCINKESSSELSEAINSMYYYTLAEFCYVYLADVPADFCHTVFRRSKCNNCSMMSLRFCSIW